MALIFFQNPDENSHSETNPESVNFASQPSTQKNDRCILMCVTTYFT